MLQSGDRILTVRHTFYKFAGWIGVLFSVFCTVMSWRANTGYLPLLFLVFGLIGFYIILVSGRMETDSKSIRFYSHLGKYEMNWNEVEYVEIDRQMGNIVFFGKNKVLQTIGPMGWTGKKERLEMATFLFGQIKNFEIDVRQTEKAMYRLSKNTKVKN